MGEITQDRIARYTSLIAAEEATLEEMSQRVAGGETLAEVCAAWDVPLGRVSAWLAADAERQSRYHRAQALWADALVAQCVPIADNGRAQVIEQKQVDGTVKELLVFPDNARDRLRVEARFRTAEKWYRERYGTGAEVVPPAKGAGVVLPLAEIARRLAFTLAQGAHAARGEKREPRLLEVVPTRVPEQGPEQGPAEDGRDAAADDI